MSPKIVDKEAKKIDILHAAMQVFAAKGVAKTKMIDIATAAKIGKGTIYEYFRSKEEIFATAFSFMFENTETAIRQAIEQTEDPVQQLKALVDISITSLLHEGSDFMAIMMDFWAEGVRKKDDEILSIIDLNKIYRAYRFYISRILQDGIAKDVFRDIDVQATSAVFIGAFDGVMLQYIVDKNIFGLENISEVLMDTFLHGIQR